MKWLLVMVLVVVLAGCNETTTQGNWNTFIGGTEGVAISFDTDSPPAEVNAGDTFYVMVKLDNKGEHSIDAADYAVTLKGFSPGDFGTSQSTLVASGSEDLVANSLDPDSGQVLSSYEVYVQVPDEELSFQGNIAGNTPFPFLAEVCYKYVTTANARLCVKEDLSDSSDTNVCVLSGPQTISSSGAPIQISNFKESRGGSSSVRFSFDVIAANTGGKIAKLDSDCSTLTNDEDRVLVKVDTGIAGLKCTGFVQGVSDSEGYVKLSGGSRQVSCTQQLSSGDLGDYVKIIEITAEYDYSQSVQTEVLVKPLVE